MCGSVLVSFVRILYKKLDKIHNFGFRDQITKSALSIPSNISEGFERESTKECLQFLSLRRVKLRSTSEWMSDISTKVMGICG
jgi:four helix bundle protein